MGQSGFLVVVGVAAVVVFLVVVPPAAVVVFAVVVVPPPPPPIGKQASDWRTATMTIKTMDMFMMLALQKCQLEVFFAFKLDLFIQKQIKDKCVNSTLLI